MDFGQYVAGPLCASLLGDQGATVVRVDPPGGPRRGCGPGLGALRNRARAAVRLDLRRFGHRVLAAALLLRADVLVENFAPRVLASLLLGGENDGRGSPEAVVARLAPRCVWLAMPGFASSDPTPRPEAWDGVVLAESGVLRDAGLNRPLRGVPVSYTSLPLPSARARRPDARGAAETRSKRRSTRRSSAPSARSSR